MTIAGMCQLLDKNTTQGKALTNQHRVEKMETLCLLTLS